MNTRATGFARWAAAWSAVWRDPTSFRSASNWSRAAVLAVARSASRSAAGQAFGGGHPLAAEHRRVLERPGVEIAHPLVLVDQPLEPLAARPRPPRASATPSPRSPIRNTGRRGRSSGGGTVSSHGVDDVRHVERRLGQGERGHRQRPEPLVRGVERRTVRPSRRPGRGVRRPARTPAPTPPPRTRRSCGLGLHAVVDGGLQDGQHPVQTAPGSRPGRRRRAP